MNHKKFKLCLSQGAMIIGILMAFAACTEDIDMSNRYTFTEYTVLSYLEQDTTYSEYVKLIKKVPISKTSKSTVAQLLSARGHITCFAPNNQAIQEYLDTLYRKYKDHKETPMTSASWDGFPQEDSAALADMGKKTLIDSIQQVIVYNSIIDGGDIKYFETANFPTRDDEEFDMPNLNDRKLTAMRDADNSDIILINGLYPLHMQHRDILAINGRIHEMLAVIAPNADSVRDKLLEWAKEGGTNYRVMAMLITACGDSLMNLLELKRDEKWEEMIDKGELKNIQDLGSEGSGNGYIPDTRKYGYTIFAETDDVWEGLLGKTVDDITIEDVKSYLIAHDLFPEAKTDNNFADQNNIINLFTTYHILPEKLTRDKLVIHYNELGYSYKTSRSYTVATEEFYTTMGKPRLLKLYESYESKGIYLNRFPILRNGRGMYAPEELNINDYHESGMFKDTKGTTAFANENEGICVEEASDTTGTIENVINGIIYPIKHLLVYSENVANQLKNQRIRFDLASVFPEMMNNDHRGKRTPYKTGHARNRGFPTNYQYFSNCEIKEGTRFFYLNGLDQGWYNWQGDEFNIVGQYEFTITLPPVPAPGHYELRLAVQCNSGVRSMCQVYWGPDKNYLPAAGIPLDMRLGGDGRHLPSGVMPDNTVGWAEDSKDDPGYNDEIDKKMRNNGFMKGPKHYSNNPGSEVSVRESKLKLRRIMVSEDMDPNKTYYLKFKNVLKSTEKQFYIDYIEYCAKEVYDNPKEGEDIW